MWLFLVVAVVFDGTLTSALGQFHPLQAVRVFGRVQWISAQKMLVIIDCPYPQVGCAATVVDIDLGRLSPEDYRGVRAGTWVTVDGVISAPDDGRSRVIATRVTEVEWEQSP